jgi:hypothetical protein
VGRIPCNSSEFTVTVQIYFYEKIFSIRLLPVAEIFSRKFASNFSTFVPNYIDLMAKEFYKSALPPLLTVEERALSCIGANGVDLFGGSMQMEFGPNTEVRLIRKHTQRLPLLIASRRFH